jgi:hypothetical protein
MTSFFNPGRFYGGFDPRLPGVIHLSTSDHFFSNQTRRRIEKDLQRGAYRWNPDDLGFALFESAYVHEAVHLLQHTTCPSMMPIFGIRNKIDIHGGIALSNFGPIKFASEEQRNGPPTLFPVPMQKWLRASIDDRQRMIADAVEEFAFLGAPDHAHPFYIDAYVNIPQVTMAGLLADRRTSTGVDDTFGGAWLALGRHYLMLEEIYQSDGVAQVSEAAAVAAQLAFVCRKMGPQAAIAVADTLTASNAYAGLADFLWRFASRTSPSVDQFLAAYVAATWCLMGVPGRDLSPAERFRVLNSQSGHYFVGGAPTKVFSSLSQGMNQPAALQCAREGYDSLLREFERDVDFLERNSSTFPGDTISTINSYGASTVELTRMGVNTLLAHADQLFTTDFLMRNTQWVLTNLVTLQVPVELSKYQSVQDWLASRDGVSAGGVQEEHMEVMINNYIGKCFIDALMLGDRVNPLPLGDVYIDSNLERVGCRRVGI